jgi:hypothetical protein
MTERMLIDFPLEITMYFQCSNDPLRPPMRSFASLRMTDGGLSYDPLGSPERG